MTGIFPLISKRFFKKFGNKKLLRKCEKQKKNTIKAYLKAGRNIFENIEGKNKHEWTKTLMIIFSLLNFGHLFTLFSPKIHPTNT